MYLLSRKDLTSSIHKNVGVQLLVMLISLLPNKQVRTVRLTVHTF